jgi:hypothetical protein
MVELILRGKAGPPKISREGTSIVVKKTIAGATVEERSPATRVTGKQAAATATYTEGELKASMKYAAGLANTYVANASVAATLAGKELSAKNAAEMKVSVRKISHLTNKLISANEDGKANTVAWTKMRGQLREATKELKQHTDKAALKKERREQREKDKKPAET